MSIEVIDNFLSQEEFDNLCNQVLTNRFSWLCSHVLNDDCLQVDPIHNFQLEHVTLNINPSMPNVKRPYKFNVEHSLELIIPILNKLPVRSLLRAKFNLNPRTSEIIEHGLHCDNPYSDATTAVFYLNTNDGYTKFEDGTIVESISNRIVKFPSSIKHTGTTCTNHPARVVLNLNYL